MVRHLTQLVEPWCTLTSYRHHCQHLCHIPKSAGIALVVLQLKKKSSSLESITTM